MKQSLASAVERGGGDYKIKNNYMEEKQTYNKKWATVEIFKSICIRNSSYNAIESVDSLWQRAKQMAGELFD